MHKMNIKRLKKGIFPPWDIKVNAVLKRLPYLSVEKQGPAQFLGPRSNTDRQQSDASSICRLFCWCFVDLTLHTHTHIQHISLDKAYAESSWCKPTLRCLTVLHNDLSNYFEHESSVFTFGNSVIKIIWLFKFRFSRLTVYSHTSGPVKQCFEECRYWTHSKVCASPSGRFYDISLNKWKVWPAGGATWKVRESPKSTVVVISVISMIGQSGGSTTAGVDDNSDII